MRSPSGVVTNVFFADPLFLSISSNNSSVHLYKAFVVEMNKQFSANFNPVMFVFIFPFTTFMFGLNLILI